MLRLGVYVFLKLPARQIAAYVGCFNEAFCDRLASPLRYFLLESAIKPFFSKVMSRIHNVLFAFEICKLLEGTRMTNDAHYEELIRNSSP